MDGAAAVAEEGAVEGVVDEVAIQSKYDCDTSDEAACMIVSSSGARKRRPTLSVRRSGFYMLHLPHAAQMGFQHA